MISMPTLVCGMTFISWLRLQPRSKRRVGSELPTHDIGIVALTAFLAVGTEGKQIEISVRTRKTINVGPAPGVGGEVFLEIGSVPILCIRRAGAQGLKAFFV